MGSFPDLGALTDEELKELIKTHTEEEQGGLVPPGRIPPREDRHPAARSWSNRPAQEAPGMARSVITGSDVQALTDILSGKSAPDADGD